MELFGWELSRKKDNNEENLQTITRQTHDGSQVVDVSGLSDWGSTGEAYGYAMSFDVDPSIISEQELIRKYREMSLVPEIEMAVDDIINEMAATDENEVVTIDLDELKYSEAIKNKINEEFDYVLRLLDFNNTAFEIIKRWYVDGRLSYHVVVDKEKYREQGIGKLVYLDPRQLKKIKVVKKDRDIRTGIELYTDKDEYYLFSESGFGANLPNTVNQTEQGIRLSNDSVVQVTSGLLNPTNTVILSYLHKAIRPLNQLRSLEDAAIIYRLARAPERRIFYIDVGNLPPAKAEQLLKRQMQQYKSKMVYDIASGTLKSDVKHMSMIEDFYLPRRGDGKATEITTLPGGQNLGEMNEVNYFLNNLYKSLNVPVSRLSQETGLNFGRVTEINRDEVKFMKFIGRLRKRFSHLFLELLKRQLALKNILHPDEFDSIRNLISFEYKSDNVFDEAKNYELMSGRLDLLSKIDSYRGVYFSAEYIKREILRLSQEQIDEMDKQIAADVKEGETSPGGGGGGDPYYQRRPFSNVNIDPNLAAVSAPVDRPSMTAEPKQNPVVVGK